MRVLLYVFVETENIGKVINALSEGGISGFFLMEYKGLSPQEWKGFLIEEDPEKAIKIVNDLARNAVMVGTVVSERRAKIIRRCIQERLSNCRYTIIEVPVEDIEVNFIE